MPIVFIPPQLRQLADGNERVEVSGTSVREVVDVLEQKYPGMAAALCRDGELAPNLQVVIGDSISRRGLNAKVTSSSEVHFLPVFGGG